MNYPSLVSGMAWSESLEMAVRRSWHCVVSPGTGSDDANCREDNGDDVRKTRSRSLVFGAWVPAVLLLYVLGIRGLVHLSLRQLVTPGTRSTSFNASTARVYLEHIAAIDSRTIGSPANEILAVNYFLAKIKEIDNKSSKVHKITVDIQRPTGSFTFPRGPTTYYDNITNIAVKLEPARGAQHAVLANCHFDSVVNSPGASDDAVSCAVMLEILSSLSNASVPLKHAIIFLFNGAEENFLQGSHGFITQHQWAKLVRAFINLDSGGVGGKELVYRTGPENPWLIQAYSAAAVHPFATVVAQEMFQSGIIPSDSDFRIYTDYGNIPGIDLAFIENGYIYHTKYDTADRIPTDSIQRAGDNILGVLQYLASSPLLADSSEYRHGNLIFFDVFGLFMVYYPALVGTIINYILAAVTLFYLIIKFRRGGKNYARDLLIRFFINVTSWIFALVIVLILAVVVSVSGNAMSWYTHFYVAVSLYGAAAVAMLILTHTMTFYFAKTSREYLGDLFFDVSLLIWGIPMMLLTWKGLCTAYFFTMWLVFSLLTKLVAELKCVHRGSSYIYMTVYLLVLFYPYFHTIYHMWIVFETFTPIFGRTVLSSIIPPDVVMACFLVCCTIILVTSFVKFIYIVKGTRTINVVAGLLAAVSGVTFILVCSGIFFPYSANMDSPKPKRIFLQHATRMFHNLSGDVVKRDSGIWMKAIDYNGITHLTPHIPELNNAVSVGPFGVLSGDSPRPFLRNDWYIPAPHPPISEDMDFKLESREQIPSGAARLNFELKGPSHITVYIRPHETCVLSSWSVGDGIPGNGRDYSIYYSHGLQAPSWKFWIEFKDSGGHCDNGTVTIAAASHYYFGENQHSPELDSLVQRFPDWSFPSGWVSSYKQYVY